MADIELVIKVPEEVYEEIKNGMDIELHFGDHIVVKDEWASERIRNGTPLPKGHGRLGDLDNIWSKLKEIEGYYQAEFLKKSNMIHESAMNGRLYGFTTSKFIVQDTPTIIEADEENKDASSN